MLANLRLIEFQFRDALDIVIVAFFLYQIYRLIARSRALPVIWGLVIVLLLIPLANILQLRTLNWIFDIVADFIVIAVIVSLQPELRRMFYRLGQMNWYRAMVPVQAVPTDEIHQAVTLLMQEKTGALIVLVNRIGLRQIMESGIMLRAQVSRELISSVFYGKNPLHDGALLIEGNMALAAACYLPMSSSSQLKKTHGARHRAGLGISEESDAFVIVVSEENAEISVAFQGELIEKLEPQDLKRLLTIFNSNKLEAEWSDFVAGWRAGGKKK